MHRQRPSILVRLFRWAGSLVLTFLVVAAGMAGVVAPLVHVDFSAVLSASMRPAFSPGDLLLSSRVPVTGLHVGQVALVFPAGESVARAHRIVSIDHSADRPALITKGDANQAVDSGKVLLTSPDVPVVFTTIPGGGYLLLWVQNRFVRAVLIALLGLIVTAAGARFLLRPSPMPRQLHKSLSPVSSHPL